MVMNSGWRGLEQQMSLLEPFSMPSGLPEGAPGDPGGDNRDAGAQPGIPLAFLTVGVSSGCKIRGSFGLSLEQKQGLRQALQTACRRAAGTVPP